MVRGVRLYLVGSLVLVALAGCGRSFLFEQREPWRREAEVTCLKSGSVKEGTGVVRISPIEGPGVCGADFPLKVASLGESSALGFADNLRPPGAIPNARSAPSYGRSAPQWPINEPRYAPPADSRNAAVQPGAPISITPPGVAQPGYEETQPYDTGSPSYGAPPRSGVTRYPSQDQYPSSYPSEPVQTRPAYPPPAAPLPALGPARGQEFVTGSAGPAAVKPAATLACPMVSALDQWITTAVQPAALRWFGQPVAEIRQISAYSCRGMNGRPGARISEHAFGNALDIAAFTLADGRRVTVKDGWRGLPEEQGFLRDVQAAACDQFNTVLAPGSNVFHYDHIHVDLMRRSSGRRICQPGAVSGDLVAERAAQRRGTYSRRGDPAVTGSIGAQRPRAAAKRGANDDDDWVEDDGPRRKPYD